MGVAALFIASRIVERLNAFFFPNRGFSVAEAMIYCFQRANHGRRPDAVYVSFARLQSHAIPDGDLSIAPDLVVEVLSASNGGIEMEIKLDEYLGAGAPMVWIVNPSSRTIRIYRADGTTRLLRASDVIENETALPGFAMKVGDVFPPLQISGDKST